MREEGDAEKRGRNGEKSKYVSETAQCGFSDVLVPGRGDLGLGTMERSLVKVFLFLM